MASTIDGGFFNPPYELSPMDWTWMVHGIKTYYLIVAGIPTNIINLY